MHQKRNSAGLTLIELMVSLMLSIFAISSIIIIYLTAEKNRGAQASLATIQENAQIVNQTLKRQMRAAAYFGCGKLTENFPFKNNLPFDLNPGNKIQHYQDPAVKPGTDAIKIWHASMDSAILTKTMSGHSSLYVSTNLSIEAGDDLIISDCKTAETFQVKQVMLGEKGTQKIVTATPLHKLYERNAEINKIEIEAFFIGDTGRVDKNNQPVYALYSKDNHAQKTEWVEGVEQMKIYFTRLKDHQLTEHPLSEISDASQVVGVSFSLDLTDNSYAKLHRHWNLYVALP